LVPHYNYFQLWHKRPNVSSTLFHDALDFKALTFAYGDPLISFFREANGASANEATLRKIMAPGFLDSLRRRGIGYVVVHPYFIRFIVERGIAAPGTAEGYRRIEAAWASRLIYRDDQIRVYRTQ